MQLQQEISTASFCYFALSSTLEWGLFAAPASMSSIYYWYNAYYSYNSILRCWLLSARFLLSWKILCMREFLSSLHFTNFCSWDSAMSWRSSILFSYMMEDSMQARATSSYRSFCWLISAWITILWLTSYSSVCEEMLSTNSNTVFCSTVIEIWLWLWSD